MIADEYLNNSSFIIHCSSFKRMSVIVQNLTKIYGQQKAVDNISFEAKKGEVLGFLGPNGAGKTTTMKIVTCFIPQTEGTAEVCGFDVAKDPLAVRARIGYLPEHNPVYKDLYVKVSTKSWIGTSDVT